MVIPSVVTRARSKRPDVQAALDVLAEHMRQGPLGHGYDASRTIRVGELEVEISISARRALPLDDASQHRQAALVELGRGFQTRCAKYVRSRGPWRRGEHECLKPIVAAVVHPPARWLDNNNRPSFVFACATHLQELSRRGGALGVVEFLPAEVKRACDERAKNYELRRRNVLIPGDSAKVDLAIEIALIELARVWAGYMRERERALFRPRTGNVAGPARSA